MTDPISAAPLRIYANTNSSCFEQIKKCFNAITQFVIKIFKQIADFFYNLFHTDSKQNPTQPIPSRPIGTDPAIPPRSASGPKNIIGFYRDGEANVDGLTIDKIRNADDNFLEQNHAWVQWAFPLAVPSAFNLTAPVLDQATTITIREDKLIGANIESVFNRVLRFYGLKKAYVAGQDSINEKIVRGDNFEQAAKNWLTHGNHNFLRITRIIRSLGLIVANPNPLSPPNMLGKELFTIMEDIYLNEGKNIISERTYQFWKNAV